MRNIARIAAVTGVTHFLGLIGKISVVMGTAGRCGRAVLCFHPKFEFWLDIYASQYFFRLSVRLKLSQRAFCRSPSLLPNGSFYYVMDALYADLVTSIVVPTMLVALLAAAVAIMFFEVFGMGTAVLLQCFIAGEKGGEEVMCAAFVRTY